MNKQKLKKKLRFQWPSISCDLFSNCEIERTEQFWSQNELYWFKCQWRSEIRYEWGKNTELYNLMTWVYFFYRRYCQSLDEEYIYTSLLIGLKNNQGRWYSHIDKYTPRRDWRISRRILWRQWECREPNLKGTIYQIRFARKWYVWLGFGGNMLRVT
jgi:hypothetical protein